MAKLDFPDTPATGELYGSSGTVWRWDGARWASTAGASGARGIVGGLKTFVGSFPIANNGTQVAIPGIAQTINAKAGRTYRVTASIGWTTAVQNDDDVAVSNTILLDGVAKNQSIEATSSRFGAGYSCRNEYIWTQAVDATVAITVTGGAYASAGGAANGSIWSSSGVPMYSLVEDITYEAGTSGTPGIVSGTPDYAVAGFAVGNMISVPPSAAIFPVQTVYADSGGLHNPAVGNFIVKKKGLYVVTAHATLNYNGATPPTQVQVEARVNSAADSIQNVRSQFSAYYASVFDFKVTGISDLNVGDTVSLWLAQTGGANVTPYSGSTSQQATHLKIAQLR